MRLETLTDLAPMDRCAFCGRLQLVYHTTLERWLYKPCKRCRSVRVLPRGARPKVRTP